MAFALCCVTLCDAPSAALRLVMPQARNAPSGTCDKVLLYVMLCDNNVTRYAVLWRVTRSKRIWFKICFIQYERAPLEQTIKQIKKKPFKAERGSLLRLREADLATLVGTRLHNVKNRLLESFMGDHLLGDNFDEHLLHFISFECLNEHAVDRAARQSCLCVLACLQLGCFLRSRKRCWRSLFSRLISSSVFAFLRRGAAAAADFSEPELDEGEEEERERLSLRPEALGGEAAAAAGGDDMLCTQSNCLSSAESVY